TDIEVERVAVEEEKERGQEDKDEQAALVASNLAHLLHGHGPGASHAGLACSTRSTTSRNTSSSDGATDATPVTRRPALARAASTSAADRDRSCSTACTAVPNRLV